MSSEHGLLQGPGKAAPPLRHALAWKPLPALLSVSSGQRTPAGGARAQGTNGDSGSLPWDVWGL